MSFVRVFLPRITLWKDVFKKKLQTEKSPNKYRDVKNLNVEFQNICRSQQFCSTFKTTSPQSIKFT